MNVSRLEATRLLVASTESASLGHQVHLETGADCHVGDSVASAGISFSDRSASAQIDFSSESYGASFGDLNGDGYLDIYASNHRLQDALYLNRRGTFYRISSQVLPWLNHKGADTHGGTFADIDNDGDQDLLISTGTGNPNMLLYNENQRLADRTADRGLTGLNVGGRLPVWLDYDGDKLLDVVMTQFGGGAKLYHQEADGTFTDVTSLSRLVCTTFHYGELFDANYDGTLDFVCPDQEVYPQRIYKTTPWLPWTKIGAVARIDGIRTASRNVTTRWRPYRRSRYTFSKRRRRTSITTTSRRTPRPADSNSIFQRGG